MKQLLPVVLIYALFPGHIDPGVTVCLRALSGTESPRETHLLIITSDLHKTSEAEQALLEAVKRWELFGTKFVVVFDPIGLWKKNDPFWEGFQKDNFAPDSRLVIVSVAWDEACVVNLFTISLGHTWIDRLIFANGSKRFIGFVRLCPQVLRAFCGKNQDCWTTVAQHELGHALGLIHRRGSLMRAGGTPCTKLGFTEHDYFHLYDTLLEDRVLRPFLTD